MRFPLLSLVLALWTVGLQAADWSSWRGPTQNGVSREHDLPGAWSLDPKDPNSNLIFAANYGSLATPVVQDGQVYVLGRVGKGPTQQERVLAFNADTGKLAWEHRLNVWHTDIVDDRLGFTNMVADKETGNVYAHGTAGQLICFTKDGKKVWERSLTEEFGRVSGYGGRVTSPIIDEDKLLIAFLNGSWGEQTIGATRLLALDKKTGQVIWWGFGGHRVKDTYYSVPVVAIIGGQRLILTGGGDGCIHAFKVRTGERVWSYKLEDGGGAINCSPVVQGNKVWIGHGEENIGNSTQGRIVCLDGATIDKSGAPKLLWQHDGIKVKFASPVLHDGLLYVCDDAGKLYCFDADKGPVGGEPLWEFRYGRNTKGSPVWADGKIYISDVDSHFVILQPSRDGCKRLSRVRFPAVGVAQTELHGSPAVANGRIYFTTTNQLVCIGKKGHKSSVDRTQGTGPKDEPTAPKGAAPAHIQVVPGDVTIRPGEKVDFKAIAYDAGGRRIGEVKVAWEKAGMLPPVFPIGLPAPKPTGKAAAPPPIAGELSAADGAATTFTAAKMPNGQFGRVVAKAGKLSGYARIRVVPALPYVMDFERVPDGRTPPAWVNAAGKFMVVTLPNGQRVLRKRNDTSNPLINMANAYIGDPDMSDYTIEADVYGTRMGDKNLPDMGVGACRYSLVMLGNDHEVRLVTWDAQKRLETKVPMDWKPGVWYRLKLTTTIDGGKGIIKGKVWPRDEKEPQKWTVEMTDPIPNTNGAPLLYGFANGSIDAKNPGPEIHYDNVKITANKK